MALQAFLSLKGKKQGQIKGSSTQKGREGMIIVIEAGHQVLSPRDAASGLPSGKRMHKPFVITKELDKSSPLLYNALVNNETINSFELKFFRPTIGAATGAGQEVHFYTVKLTNATICDISFKMPNVKDPEQSRLLEYEQVSFTYQKIEWVIVEGGITAMDDWETPIV